MNLANAITLLNLIGGMTAIILAINGKHEIALLIISMNVILDFLDGFIARKLKQESKIGEQLDSLADLISFAIAPTIILILKIDNPGIWIYFSVLFFVASGARRLARYNSQKNSTKNFLGMPITINGILLPIIIFFLNNNYIISAILIVLSILMISKIKFPRISLK